MSGSPGTDEADGEDDTDVGTDGTYDVELVHDGETVSLSVDADEYVLDAAEEAGLDLSYSCRQGQCTSCVGTVLDGDVDQSEGTALDPMQQEDGYALLCIASPTTDCRIETDTQDDMFGMDI